MDYRPDDMGATQVPYTGITDVMPLRGPLSQLLTLSVGEVKRIQWAPTDRRVAPIEIFCRVASWKGDPFATRAVHEAPPPPTAQSYPVGTQPEMRWRIVYGHGNYTVTDPPYASPETGIVRPNPAVRYLLPARGLLVRLSSRELVFELEHFTADASDDTYSSVTAVVSFQPTESVIVPYGARQEVGRGSLALQPLAQVFPAWALEWKLTRADGTPFAAEANDYVDLLGLDGQPRAGSVPYERAYFADWLPIPTWAWAWRLQGGPSISAYAVYR